MKILHIINESILGGGQRHVFWLLRELNKDPDIEASLACAGGGDMWPSLNSAASSTLEVDIRMKIAPGEWRKLKNFIAAGEFDVVHTHGGVAGLWGRLAARRAGVPAIIHTLHGIHYLNANPVKRRLGISLERCLSRFSDRVIYVGPSDYQSGRQFNLSPQDKSVLIRNAVDDPRDYRSGKLRRANLLDQEDDPDKIVMIGCIARLSIMKGHIYLLEALHLLKNEFPNLRLLLIGSGPLESELKDFVQQYQLQSQVRFLGNRGDVYDVMPLLDILVQSSLWEGLSLTLLEAMASGCSIVSSKTTGIVDVLTDRQTALLVPPKDASALAAALREMIRDGKLRQKLGENARLAYEKESALPDMISKVIDTYRKALVK